jgi:hypothetical protein
MVKQPGVSTFCTDALPEEGEVSDWGELVAVTVMVGRTTQPFVGAPPAALSMSVPNISHAVKKNQILVAHH